MANVGVLDKELIDELRAEVARLTAERNEARSMVRQMAIEAQDDKWLWGAVHQWDGDGALPVGPHPTAEFSETDSGSLDVPAKDDTNNGGG